MSTNSSGTLKKRKNLGDSVITVTYDQARFKLDANVRRFWAFKGVNLLYPNMFLLLDKSAWNKNKTVIGYLERNKIPYMSYPTGASDLNATEECRRQTRENVTANKSHNSEKELLSSLESYWRKNPFKHNMLNYLI